MSMEETQTEVVNTTSVEAQTSANNTGVNRFAKHTGLFVDFDYLGIKIASPERILSWSYGEVKSSDTINYRTFKPERDGLFCARIFGPIKDYECLCGKYRRIKYKGIRCEKCDVEVTQSRIRRERMGHITLAYPALNILYLRSVPSKISILLDQTAKDIERVLYFEKYIVIDAGTSPLNKYETLSYEEYERAMNEYGQDAFKVGIGAKGLRSALESMNLQEEREKVARQLEVAKSEIKQTHIRRRLQLIEDFIQSGNRPEWMVFTVLPVLPPDLRPLVQLDGGKSAISDLNTLYARIINRNNRLKKLMEMNAPEIIIQNECRMLQDAVSSLLNNSSSNNAKVAKAQNGRPLKSISDNLKGKRGRLRQNLLGKRVDYSGRSVIVCGPELRLHECGVPKEMALELFKPFVLSKLRLYGKAITIRQGNAMIKARVPEVWEILEDVIKEHPVLLNRAPTLHRLGIQAFEPKLIETKAMQVHPLVCRAFNADFDGDQMAIHVPLSIEAQLEARILMMSSNNILSSANGTPMIVPRKDITVGLYYMTTAFDGEPGEKHAFYSQDDVMLALQNREITINSKIKYYFKYEDAENEDEANKMQCAEETTAGRIMLYSYLPHDGKIKFDYLNKQWSIGFLGDIVQTVYTTYGPKITVIFCDQIMYKGFLYSTLSGISFGKDDIKIPEDKPELIADVMQKINEIGEQYKEGYITNKERYNKVTDLWAECTDQLCDEVMVSLKENSNNRKINSIALMMNSGARASKAQMKQLAGMKGLIAKPNGAIIETAVTSNFKEGLSVMEFFNAAHGARKGNVDTALKTADAGYLTRRLVDVAQDCIITEEDCGSTEGVKYHAKVQDGKVITKLSEIIKGRFLAEDVVDGNGNVLIKANTLIGKEEVKILDENEVASATVRSPVTCKCKYGICSKCYGIDLATSQVVNVGEAVGVIAAQTIGEPGTQLTLNTFHIGGVATKDIAESVVDAQSAGTIRYADLKYVVDRDGDKIVISNSGHIEIVDANGKLLFSHFVGYSSKLFVEDGEKVKLGQRLAEWDPYNIYVIAEQDGIARLDDMIPGTSYQESVDEALGRTNKIIINWADTMKDLKPCVSVLGKDGKEIVDEHGISAKYYLSVGAITHVNDGDEIKVGDKIAKVLREDKSVVKDITGGLPRVEEIFEARAPKNSSIVAGADGYIEFGKTSRLWIEIKLHPDDKNIDDIVYKIPKGKYIAVRDGGRVRNGDIIMGGTLNPYDILRFQGISALTSYIVNEVQGVYKLQGIDIDSKHIEIIAKYMLNKVLIKDCGGTSLRNDYQYEISTVREENEKALEKGLAPAKYERLFYGITKSSLQTESFISAASFQETVKVLTDAAIKGKKDPLRGMKESIIIGRLIPAGTGFITRQLKQEANKISNVSNTSIDIDNL